VDRLQFRIPVLGCELIGPLNRFLRFYREFVPTDCHDYSIWCFVNWKIVAVLQHQLFEPAQA
jgi:hypothetical protein